MAKMTMGRAVKRWWRYVAAWLHVRQNDLADPRIQLEQAIQEAQENHHKLTKQAATVIAHQKQAEDKLHKAIAEYERVHRVAGQALMLADQKSKAGDPVEAARLTEAAEASASRVLSLRTEIDALQVAVLQATQHAEDAHARVMENRDRLQEAFEARERLLNDLERAQMYEESNKAREIINATTSDRGPTLREVENKIQKRLTQAESYGEVLDAQISRRPDALMREVESAVNASEARAMLDQMRADLGLRPALALEPPSDTTAPLLRALPQEETG
jgi:phage shock protein A